MRAQLLTAFESGQISRRQFVSGLLKLGLSASAAAAVLAACSKDNEKPRPGPKNLSGRIQVLTTGGTAAQLAVQQALVEAFVRRNADLGVDFIRATSVADARERLTALIDLDRAPDLVLPVSAADLAHFVDRDMWLDLRGYLDDADVSIDDFPRVTHGAARMTSYYGDGSDRVVAVPLGVHAHALAYNAGLFARSEIPAPPESLNDASWRLESTFLDTARRLTSAGQFGAGHLSAALSFFGFGGRYYDRESRRAQFDRPASIAGAQFAAELIRTHRVQVPRAEEVAAWRGGKVAMIELSSGDAAALTDGVPFEWRLAALPAGPSRRHTGVDVQLGAIVKASGQHDLAWKLLNYLAVDTDTTAKAAADGFGAIPVRSAAQFASTPAPWRDAIEAGSAEESAWLPAFSTVHDLADRAQADIIGGAAAADVMEKLQRDAQRAIDDWFDDNELP